eukprot:scaffold29493_cov42-Phaeocystis_antarctica.AAC.4
MGTRKSRSMSSVKSGATLRKTTTVPSVLCSIANIELTSIAEKSSGTVQPQRSASRREPICTERQLAQIVATVKTCQRESDTTRSQVAQRLPLGGGCAVGAAGATHHLHHDERDRERQRHDRHLVKDGHAGGRERVEAARQGQVAHRRASLRHRSRPPAAASLSGLELGRLAPRRSLDLKKVGDKTGQAPSIHTHRSPTVQIVFANSARPRQEGRAREPGRGHSGFI